MTRTDYLYWIAVVLLSLVNKRNPLIIKLLAKIIKKPITLEYEFRGITEDYTFRVQKVIGEKVTYSEISYWNAFKFEYID